MDKLKPILEQRFWILSGLAILLTFVGWSMGKSSLASMIQTRRDKLKAAFDSVSGSGANPNEKWTQQIVQRNALQEKELRLSYEQLYDRQQAMKFWPEGISEPARVDITKATQTDLEIYRAKYVDHALQVHQMIQPVEETEEGEIVGKISFPAERLGVIQKNDMIWRNVAPTPQQVYEAQEDLWLYANLFTALAKINESASGQFDATVREVYELRLRGGDPANIGTSSASTVSAGPTGGHGGPADGMADVMPGGSPAMMGQNSGAKYNTGNVDFNPDDEFGPDGGSASGNPAMESANMPISGDVSLSGGSQPEATPIKRYVHETPQYRTRGFYMKVAIDHRRLPDFLAGLTNAPWGIRITRVHQMDMQPDDLVEAAGGGSPGGFASGMPGGSSGFPGAANPLAAGHGAGPTAFPGGSAAPAFPGVSAAPGLPAPGLPMPGVGSSGMEGVGVNAAANSAAMADPDLAIVAVDGWIVMYLPPPADPNAPSPATTTDPAAPAALESGTPQPAPPAQAAPAGPATDGPTAPADPAAAAPAAATEPAGTPAPASDIPPADAPATAAPTADAPKPDTPTTPAEPKPAAPAANP